LLNGFGNVDGHFITNVWRIFAHVESERLTLVVALAPSPSFLTIGCGICRNDNLQVDWFSNAQHSSFPSTLTGLLPLKLTLVDLKVAVGNLAVSESPWMCR
jgi:hypothetical protein